MPSEAPLYIQVDSAHVEKFERSLASLLKEVVAGNHAVELREHGIVLPQKVPSDLIATEVVSEQGVATELYIILAIRYSPLVIRIGEDVWNWAWPKLRDRFDGVVREDIKKR